MKGIQTFLSTSSTDWFSSRYGPIRQYCSSRMSSSTQPLPGTCSRGWLRNKKSGRRGAAPAPLRRWRRSGPRCARRRGRRRRRRSFCRETASRRRSPRSGRRRGQWPLAASIIPGRFGVPSPGRLQSCAPVGSTPVTRPTPGRPAASSGELALAASDVEDAGRARRGDRPASGTICSCTRRRPRR